MLDADKFCTFDSTSRRILQARILEWVAFLSPGDPPNPGIKSRSPSLQVDYLPAGDPQGKPLRYLEELKSLSQKAYW